MADDDASYSTIAPWRQSMDWACRTARCNHFNIDVADFDFVHGRLSALDKNSTNVVRGEREGEKRGCMRADASESEKKEESRTIMMKNSNAITKAAAATRRPP